MGEENKTQNQFIAKPEQLSGAYANNFQLTVQERDIVIDFISAVNIHGNTTSSLVARIFLNHFVAKDLAKILNEIINKWEEHKYSLPPTTPPETPKK
jgi:hypothetical protein